MPVTLPPGQKPIVFFDGICGMCNAAVDLLLRLDRHGQLVFAPLQGSTSQELLPAPPENPQAWSMLYLDEAGLHDQSDALLAICRRLGGVVGVLGLARFIPQAIRNAAYRFIARHRHRFFGKKEACRLPTPEERTRFLP